MSIGFVIMQIGNQQLDQPDAPTIPTAMAARVKVRNLRVGVVMNLESEELFVNLGLGQCLP